MFLHIFIICTSVMLANRQQFDLTGICKLETDVGTCKWMGKGLYSASLIITLRKLIFPRFYNTGRINVREQNHIHRVDILSGSVKCTDIWSSSNTEIFIAGHKCVMSRRQLTSSSAGLLSRALSIFHNLPISIYILDISAYTNDITDILNDNGAKYC